MSGIEKLLKAVMRASEAYMHTHMHIETKSSKVRIIFFKHHNNRYG